jgi:hypothetical protein
MENLPSKNDYSIQAGEVPQEVKLIANGMFEAFAINYPFWNHGLLDEQVLAKKRLWSSRLVRFGEDEIARATNIVLDTIGDKAGPVLEQFLEIVHAERRAQKRKQADDEMARDKGFRDYDHLCQVNKIGRYA